MPRQVAAGIGWSAYLILLALPLVMTAGGCGGSSSPVAPPPRTTIESSPFYFHADVVTGRVTALEPGDPRLAGIETVSPQVVGTNTGVGKPLEVRTSNQLNNTGNPGRRAVAMWVKSNLAEPVGELPGGQRNGLDLVFTSLVFRDAGSAKVHGGSVGDPDKYDPNTGLPIFTLAGRLGPGQSSGARSVVFSLPKTATQVIWGVIVRTDTALPCAYPQPGGGCWVTTVAGTGVPGFSDGPAHMAAFDDPYGLCVAPDGSVLIADRDNNAVRELLPTGTVRTVPDLGVDLRDGLDVSIDLANSTPTSQIVYLACGGTLDRVFRLVRNPATNTTTSITVIAGAGASPDATTADNLDLNQPCGLDADLCNGFWLADTGLDRVFYLRLESGANPRTAGPGQYQVVKNITSLTDVEDVSVDDFGNAFAVDDASLKLHRIDADGTITSKSVGGMSYPACVVNGAGTVCYMKDSATDKVRQVRLTGADPKSAASWTLEEITKGGTGYQDGSGAGARFRFLDSGLALDPSGSLWVTDNDNHRIRRIDRMAGA